MGLEVGDGSPSASASASASEGAMEDPVAPLIESCEALDLGGAVASASDDVAVVADCNGHLTTEEEEEVEEQQGISEQGETPIEQAGEQVPPVQPVSGFQPQKKSWSDFNAVSARTFGEQSSFGSFSDFLADLPSESSPPQPSSHVTPMGSDVDFFSWAEGESDASPIIGIGSGFTTPQPQPPAVPAVQEALAEEEPTIAGINYDVLHEVSPASSQIEEQHQNMALDQQQQVATWSDYSADQGQKVVDEADALQSTEDPYPGWYYDYQVNEWRQIEGYSAGGTAAVETSMSQYIEQSSSSNNALEMAGGLQLDGSQVQGEVVQSHSGLEESQAWGVQSSATQTTTDQYPGWTWDPYSQTWLPVAGYEESTQAYTGQEQSWYGQQEQQQQTLSYNDQAYGSTSGNQQDPSQQLSQSFYSGYIPDSTHVVSSGYASQSANSVNPSLGYGQEPQIWQPELPHNNAMGGVAPAMFTPQMNGSQGWAPSVYNTAETAMSPSVPANAFSPVDPYSQSSSYHGYSQNGMLDNFSQPTWGSNSQYNQYQHKSTNPTAPPPKNVQEAMQTCVGRPPHSLATFGFGGKLIFMKLRDPVTLHTSNGDQAVASGQAWMPGPVQVKNLGTYLYKESSYVGPLMGGGASSKDLNKWIDERVFTYQPYDSSRLLLGLLKVACQHYGKLRSLNGTAGNSSMEEDGPEAALAKLLAGSAGDQGAYPGGAHRSTLALQGMPSEQQLEVTSAEVKKLLVSGKRKEALMCAQHGELWGVAIVLARQLGEKFYSDTVMEMARRQFVAGSPLRTLSLLLAGQPAEVFAVPPLQPGNFMDGAATGSNSSQDVVGAMLDEWQENLAIMAANRTVGDERVILHLGDRLWGVRGEVGAAHLCYLVADVNLECYSGTSRLCLIGADHCKNPRTYATAEAIQRTEIFEHAKVLGNPQSVLLTFQPYKLVYAEMLAEVGKTAEALRYCNTVLKTLKTAGRTPDVEACRLLATNMEERLRVHQQDGHGSRLAPGKLVNRFISTMDWSIHKLIGGPPAAPVADPYAYKPLENGVDYHSNTTLHTETSSGQRFGAPLAPSASIATSMERLPEEPKRGPARSQSEPDFGRNAKQGGDGAGSSPRAGGLSRLGLGRLGSTFLQKATGLWGSQKKEAKLGEANKFYYDEKLKKWVEEGVEAAPEAALPPPPPTTSSFMGSSPQDESHTPPSATLKPGIPPMIPSGSNQFSNRRQAGVRSRYVDTFNKGGSTTTKSLMPSLLPPPRAGGAMPSMPAMFVPAPIPSSSLNESTGEMGEIFMNGASRNGDESTSLGATSEAADFYSGRGGHTPTAMNPYAMVPDLTISENGLAFPTLESSDRDQLGGPPTFGGAHTRAASWSGYPSSYQNSQFSGEDDSYGTSSSGTDRFTSSDHVPVMASTSGSPSSFTNFYMPNSGMMNVSLPPPPPLAAPTASLRDMGSVVAESRDPSRDPMGQHFKGSQSVDSLAVEEMQEVEL